MKSPLTLADVLAGHEPGRARRPCRAGKSAAPVQIKRRLTGDGSPYRPPAFAWFLGSAPVASQVLAAWAVGVSLGALLVSSAAAASSAPVPPLPSLAVAPSQPSEAEKRLLTFLDAPLLFVKRHSYTGIHIYDTYYKWPPGGGGIYLLQNPQAPRSEWTIRPIIDPTTPGTLGTGVYTHPDLSWDATKLLFCFKGKPDGSTAIYEIGIDGRGLRRVTDPTPACACYKGVHGGQHDLAPAYLPDGRIVLLSTRPSGLVPCANEGVSILHVMNADGSDLHPISVNNVNEFDPSVLPDGRILFGRWEYVDKNALTIQSLWTIHPDGTEETAFYANNMVLPEAILDARSVPDSHRIIGTFAKHNASPRGSIAWIDPRLGKNGTNAITNLEHPGNPTCDTGDSCEPWPLSEEVVLFSGRPAGTARNVIEIMDRARHRVVLLSDTNICLHAPMLVKPRPRPAVLQPVTDPAAKTGRFFVQDIYRGLTGVRRGEVKWLRIIEETSRVSATHRGANPYNQTFLVSAALAFSVKNYLGVVPVDAQGSAYFEVPSGRALYWQALDGDGRLVQSMRTFVQAAPGVTRSCIGCHEHKADAPGGPAADRDRGSGGGHARLPLTPALSPRERERGIQRLDKSQRSGLARAPEQVPPLPGGEGRGEGERNTHSSTRIELSPTLRQPPSRPQPESWGSGFMDYPSRVQPILDRHCVRCHGGRKDIAAGLDLSGGWTEHFNLSYENLVSRRETQLIAYWIAGIDCMNGTAYWSSQLFAPRGHGSGAAPLADVLIDGHHGDRHGLTRSERDLLFAWIDSNGLYHGSWDYTEHGCAVPSWPKTKQSLVQAMQAAGCIRCHGETNKITYFENDWFNLQDPELSRILRAPLPPGAKGFGLGWCRDRHVDPKQQRVRLLRDGYAHAIQPVDKFARQPIVPRNTRGAPVATFASTQDPHYQAMLAIIRAGREQALAAPRVDLPGAEVIAGACRQFNPPPLPKTAPPLTATCDADGVVRLSWEQSARTIGLAAEWHRGPKRKFVPDADTRLAETGLSAYADPSPSAGRAHYALVLISGSERSQPAYASVSVPRPAPPPEPVAVQATPGSCSIRLRWQAPNDRRLTYHVYRGSAAGELRKLTEKAIRATAYTDTGLEAETPYTYVIRAVTRRGLEGRAAQPVTASARLITQPVFRTTADPENRGLLFDGEVLSGQKHGKAAVTNAVLEFKDGGHITFPHRAEFELDQPLSVACWVWLDAPGKSPVLVSCGEWRQAGWFLQRLGDRWRWHVGGVDCDGGKPAVGRWVHLAGTFDGQVLRLFEDGVQVAEATGAVKTDAWPGELHIGQYSAGPGADFQVHGRMTGVKVYHRPLAALEVADACRKQP